MGPGGPLDLQNRWGAPKASPEGSFPSPPANSNLPAPVAVWDLSAARREGFDGNADGNGSRCLQSTPRPLSEVTVGRWGRPSNGPGPELTSPHCPEVHRSVDTGHPIAWGPVGTPTYKA